MGKLTTNEVFQIRSFPFRSNKQILACRKPVDSFLERVYRFQPFGPQGMARNGHHQSQQILGSVIYLTHQEMNVCFVTLLFCNVDARANDFDCVKSVDGISELAATVPPHPVDVAAWVDKPELHVQFTVALGGKRLIVESSDMLKIIAMYTSKCRLDLGFGNFGES